MKRDLKADLELLEAGFHPSDIELVGIAEHAIERALRAESLVRKYEEIGCTPEEVIDVVRRFTSFLCEMTGGLMSKPNYTLEDMIAVADDYHQKICDESLQENVKHATEMEDLAWELIEALGEATWLLEGYTRRYEDIERLTKELVKAKEVLGDG